MFHRIGSVYSAQGDKGKALQYFKEALTINKAFYGNRHESLAITW